MQKIKQGLTFDEIEVGFAYEVEVKAPNCQVKFRDALVMKDLNNQFPEFIFVSNVLRVQLRYLSIVKV